MDQENDVCGVRCLFLGTEVHQTRRPSKGGLLLARYRVWRRCSGIRQNPQDAEISVVSRDTPAEAEGRSVFEVNGLSLKEAHDKQRQSC